MEKSESIRTFVLRARKGSTNANKLRRQVGSNEHIEVVAHTLANAFYFSNGMRDNVEVYVILESSPDFPRTLRFSSREGLSMPGFDEQSILGVLAAALEKGKDVAKNSAVPIAPGIELYGYGFDKLAQELLESRPVYLLDRAGEDIRTVQVDPNAVFILSDHLPMPPKSIKGLERKGLRKLRLGKKMLFASQCVVLVHDQLDRTEP